MLIKGHINWTNSTSNLLTTGSIGGSSLSLTGTGAVLATIHDSGADTGGGLLYLRTSRGGAVSNDDDFCGYFGFQFYDSGNNLTNGADINVQVKDNTHPIEAADIFVREMVNGSLTTVLTFSGGHATFANNIIVTGSATLGSVSTETIGLAADPDLMQLALNALTVNGTIAASTGSTIGNLTLADGSITASGGTLSFGDENVSWTGTAAMGRLTVTGDGTHGARVNQGADSKGIYIYGYDDRDSSYAHTYISSTGNTLVSTSGAFSVIAGAQVGIYAGTNKDIIFQLGDAAGAEYVEIRDSGSALVASIDSNGVVDTTEHYEVDGTQVVTSQQAHIADSSTQDLTGTDTIHQANLESDLAGIVAAVNSILSTLETHGLVAAA